MLSAPLQTFVSMLAGWGEEQRAVIDYSPLPSSNIGIRRVPKPARWTENDVSEAPQTPAISPIHARLSFGTGRDRRYRKGTRYYADLRDHADVGGKQEAMRPAGSAYATQDRDEASRLLVARLEELEEFRKRGQPAAAEDPLLADYAKRRLELKAGRFKASSVRHNEVARATRRRGAPPGF